MLTNIPNVPKFLFDHIVKKALQMSNSTSLVVWGINLTSSEGNGRISKQESNMVKLPYYQKNVIIGLLLSDGWLTFGNKRSNYARLGFKQSLAHSAYVWFVFNILSHYCNSGPHLTSSTRVGKTSYGLGIFTRSLSCFTELYSVFYPNGVKIIPEDIYNLLTRCSRTSNNGRWWS
uniref:hypothetical protein n=1 Tax=Drechslerella dactyloides TaxID=74499 RepID=UPI0022FD981C|nr:hypothetical protein PNX16_mgp014 [Drechslerella dactyloides]WAN89837.1 hypothetical protein [Drechslerella dactyloides]